MRVAKFIGKSSVKKAFPHSKNYAKHAKKTMPDYPHGKPIDLAPDWTLPNTMPERVDPRRVRILEHGEFRPLIWDKSDELAVDKGMLFSPHRAYHFRDVIHNYFKLWQGEYVGQPATLEDDWQWACLSRIFGWVDFSSRWQRWIRRFTDADVWVPKKNKKSPTAAFVGIYLWAFDGESGQQVYSVAKDGKQALRVHEHVLNMVRASKMMDHVRINKTTGQLLHLPTLSTYAVLHGDNFESQEGLNGSYVMDEVHVVPQKLANILRGMGASRSEPLNFRVSTAGSDPESYGHRRYLTGQSYAEGKLPSCRTFFKSYEAPQNLQDEQLNNIEIWKSANPCWGRTIDESEFRREFDECSKSAIDFAGFKQRRLNIWQRTSAPWINENDWLKCLAPFDPLELKGTLAVMAADFSRTRDLTSVALAWEKDGKVYIHTHSFIPSQRAHQLADKVPFADWEKLGHVTIVKGRTLDESIIANKMKEWLDTYRIPLVQYDPMFAAGVVNRLVEAGYNPTYREFKQTLFHFTPATIRVDRLVVEGNLVHNGAPILTWEFCHATLKKREDFCKPMKPDDKDYHAVDAVQAVLMAVAGLPELKKQPNSDNLIPMIIRGDGTIQRF